VKGYMFHALLCKFAECGKAKTVPVAAVSAMEEVVRRYKDLHPALDGSREAKFIEQLIKSWKDEKVEDAATHIATQNRVRPPLRLCPLPVLCFPTTYLCLFLLCVVM
jgi:hypothetical protein